MPRVMASLSELTEFNYGKNGKNNFDRQKF
jgi:hypothetical protein